LDSSRIRWTWKDVPDEKGYRVETATGGRVSPDLAPGTTFWIEGGLSPNAPAARRAVSFNEAASSAAPPLTRHSLAAPPAALAVTKADFTSCDLAWNENGNPPGTLYQVDIASTGVPASTLVAGSGTTLGGLRPGTAYSIRLRSMNREGQLTEPGLTVSTATPVVVTVTENRTDPPPVHAEAIVYPNPFRSALGHDRIRFEKLPPGTRLFIHTLAGERVKTLTVDGTGRAEWDADDESGESLASGVYHIFLEGEGKDESIPLVIQR
jgi:hypothetical protein